MKRVGGRLKLFEARAYINLAQSQRENCNMIDTASTQIVSQTRIMSLRLHLLTCPLKARYRFLTRLFSDRRPTKLIDFHLEWSEKATCCWCCFLRLQNKTLLSFYPWRSFYKLFPCCQQQLVTAGDWEFKQPSSELPGEQANKSTQVVLIPPLPRSIPQHFSSWILIWPI